MNTTMDEFIDGVSAFVIHLVLQALPLHTAAFGLKPSIRESDALYLNHNA